MRGTSGPLSAWAAHRVVEDDTRIGTAATGQRCFAVTDQSAIAHQIVERRERDKRQHDAMQPVPFVTCRQTGHERDMEYRGRIRSEQCCQHQEKGLSHRNPRRVHTQQIRDPRDRTSDDTDITNHADCS